MSTCQVTTCSQKQSPILKVFVLKKYKYQLLLVQLDNPIVGFVNRSAYESAHVTARYAASYGCNRCWFDLVPDFLNSVVISELPD